MPGNLISRQKPSATCTMVAQRTTFRIEIMFTGINYLINRKSYPVAERRISNLVSNHFKLISWLKQPVNPLSSRHR